MICPLSGQVQASLSAMWQVEVTVLPLPSIAVQLVQCEVNLALAGVVSNTALKTMAPTLTSKSIFFLTLEFSLSARSKAGLSSYETWTVQSKVV